MRIEDRVIPARFLVTLGHLIGVTLVFKTKSDNVYAGLSFEPTVTDVATANSSVNVSVFASFPFLSSLAKYRQCLRFRAATSVAIQLIEVASWAHDSENIRRSLDAAKFQPLDSLGLTPCEDLKSIFDQAILLPSSAFRL